MDVWVNFTNASRWQAEGIFKCFFPSKPPAPKEVVREPTDESDDDEKVAPEPSASVSVATDKEKDTAQKNLPGSKRKAAAITHAVPLLDAAEIDALAKRFAAQIPENELSVASLQGYLLKNKTRPRESVEEVADWIIKEREMKAKLKKEKEEKEAQEKKEAEEKAAKEKKEKAAEEAKEVKEEEKEEKKEKKEKKSKAKESSVKAETAAATASTSTVASETEQEPSTASSSDADTDGSGAEADTEDSLTTDEEVDKLVDAATSAEPAKEGTEKWVNVKGTPQQQEQPASTVATEAVEA